MVGLCIGLICLEMGIVECFCKYINESSNSIKGTHIRKELTDSQLLKKGSLLNSAIGTAWLCCTCMYAQK
jgi:calcineurin-like phosphoesterase